MARPKATSETIAYFRVVAEGAHLPEPFDRIYTTAVEAATERRRQVLLCGRSGKVKVFNRAGQTIAFDRLEELAAQTVLKASSNHG